MVLFWLLTDIQNSDYKDNQGVREVQGLYWKAAVSNTHSHTHVHIFTHSYAHSHDIFSHTHPLTHSYTYTCWHICFHTHSITYILTTTCLQISHILTHVSSPTFSHSHAHKCLTPSHTFAIYSHRFHTDMLTHPHSLSLILKTSVESAFNEAFAGGSAGSGRVRKNSTDCHGAYSALSLGRWLIIQTWFLCFLSEVAMGKTKLVRVKELSPVLDIQARCGWSLPGREQHHHHKW